MVSGNLKLCPSVRSNLCQTINECNGRQVRTDDRTGLELACRWCGEKDISIIIEMAPCHGRDVPPRKYCGSKALKHAIPEWFDDACGTPWKSILVIGRKRMKLVVRFP